ncbi:MAG: hypothetical protein KKE30_04600 [Gammaproteobacteria bacterium]|nr:hypothetical protein [Gammaproteobacteria bacterium]
MKHRIIFNDDTHIYYVNNRRVPSVTQIIQEFFPFNGGGLAAERARIFGEAVHKAIELKIKKTLDESTVDDAVRGYLNQWECYYPTDCIREVRLYSKKYNFCGTIDEIRRDAVIDTKTGQYSPTHRLQIAAYRYLWNENFKKNKIANGLIVYLDGSESPPKTIHEQPEDLMVFFGLLNAYNWKRKEK